MKKFERVISVIMLCVISLSNVATPAVYAAQIAVANFSIPGTRTDKRKFAPTPKFSMSDTGSVLAASTSILSVGTGPSLDLQDSNSMSANKRIPIQMQQLTKKVFRTDEDVT